MAGYSVLPSLFSKPDFNKRRFVRTVSMLCEEEPLTDIQLKAYQTRLQEYKNFLEVVSRLASTGNVCVTEESVSIGENGLLTGEALNALQHAGSISVYNTLQQNNWKFPVPEEGEVVILKRYTPVTDEFLDSENPIRSDWPAICLTDCFIEGERARLNGSVQPVRSYLPPNITYRNVADVDDDSPETENTNMPVSANEDGFEIFSTDTGLMVKRPIRDGKDVEIIPIEDYYFGRQDGSVDYRDERGEYRYKCAVCDKMFYSNVNLMYHMLGHVDKASQKSLNFADLNQCPECYRIFPAPSDLRNHVEQVHQPATTTVIVHDNSANQVSSHHVKQPQTASQLLMQQQQAANQQAQITISHQSADQVVGRHCPTECRICGKEVSSEFSLAHHLQSVHRQREMPYVCRLCGSRSSLYEDILDHFKKIHGGSNHLLCIYCLRVFTINDALLPSSSNPVNAIGSSSGLGQTSVYYQHLKMHLTPNQCRKCPACKLSFSNKSDYQLHRKLDHKGSTIPYSVQSQLTLKQEGVEMELGEEAADGWLNEASNVKRMNAPGAARVTDLSFVVLPEEIGELLCIECGTMIASKEHKQYLPCSLCRFATCCARSFTRHGKQMHGLGSFVVNTTMYPGHKRKNVHGNHPLTDESSNLAEGEESIADPEPPAAMDSAVVAESFYCSECLSSGFEGNALAQHLVEECGVHFVTMKPDPSLLAAKQENDRIKLLRQEEKAQDLYALNEKPVESTEPMDSVAPGNTVMVQFGEEGEEEMQQFVLPEGLTLEEGQTLVMIQGEDGQPQLAIVNQEDLITSEDQEPETVLMEGDEEAQGIIYETVDGQPGGVPPIDEEKENQFS